MRASPTHKTAWDLPQVKPSDLLVLWLAVMPDGILGLEVRRSQKGHCVTIGNRDYVVQRAILRHLCQPPKSGGSV